MTNSLIILRMQAATNWRNLETEDFSYKAQWRHSHVPSHTELWWHTPPDPLNLRPVSHASSILLTHISSPWRPATLSWLTPDPDDTLLLDCGGCQWVRRTFWEYKHSLSCSRRLWSSLTCKVSSCGSSNCTKSLVFK